MSLANIATSFSVFKRRCNQLIKCLWEDLNMNSFGKNILIGILVIGVLIIGSLGAIIIGLLLFNSVPSTVTTVQKQSFIFSKVPANDLRVVQRQFFNITTSDLANFSSLKLALGIFINSTNQQFTCVFPNTQSFDQLKDFFNSRSNNFSVFSYYNNFIAFIINE